MFYISNEGNVFIDSSAVLLMDMEIPTCNNLLSIQRHPASVFQFLLSSELIQAVFSTCA